MGARLALDKPLDPEHSSIQSNSPPDKGDGVSVAPRFSLLGSSVEDRKRRWLVLGVSPFLEALVVAAMFWALVSLPPSPLLNKVKQEVLYFHPAAPEAARQAPRLLKRPALPKETFAAHITPKLRQNQVQKPPDMARLRAPEISQPKIELPQTPAPKRQATMLHTGAFSPGSMAKATVQRAPREVQTGGFGAENGIPNDPAVDSHQHVAQLGSFDLPTGPGQGNGTGEARGVRDTVASVGFGNGIGAGTGALPNSAAPARVRQGAFGNVVAGTAHQTHAATQAAAFKPVVILSKPDPVYPPEARRLHIEGQVTLSVLFGSTGNLRVLKVVQGLGHGMDQAAAAAAELIRFKPAERDGRPVDSTAMVHIIFQLAY